MRRVYLCSTAHRQVLLHTHTNELIHTHGEWSVPAKIDGKTDSACDTILYMRACVKRFFFFFYFSFNLWLCDIESIRVGFFFSLPFGSGNVIVAVVGAADLSPLAFLNGSSRRARAPLAYVY